MDNREPQDPQAPRASSEDSVLRRLEQRLDRASEAAERLVAEAASAAAQAGSKPPPAGWQTSSAQPEGGHSGDFDLLVQAVHALRDLIPAELQRRLAEALRELLLALRALIDWYLERSERRRSAPAEVQDIPIA